MTIPANVDYFGNYAFADCSALTKCSYQGFGLTLTWHTTTFDHKVLKTVTVPSNYREKEFCDIPVTHSKQAAAEIKEGSCGDKTDGCSYLCYYHQQTLIISGRGDMSDYTEPHEQPWYWYRDNITVIEIDDGITSIGDYAFYDMPKLTSVDMGKDIGDIGKMSFSDCQTISTIKFSGEK